MAQGLARCNDYLKQNVRSVFAAERRGTPANQI